MTRLMILASLTVALSGCVATGTKVHEGQLTQFQRGLTTYSDVVAVLGKPTQATLHADGRRQAVYTYTQSQARAVNYIPVAAAFLQGGDTEQSTVVLEFAPDGTLIQYTMVSGALGTGTGFLSGTRQ
jgi:hypothetical protein